MQMPSSAIAAVLQFWFGDAPPTASLYPQRRQLWFGKKTEFDQECRDRFLALHHQAATGMLDQWQQSPLGCLALILLLDQFPRNMFRDTPSAFATDPQALAVAKWAIDQDFDQALAPVQRMFIYLPLEHSENLSDQQQAVRLLQPLAAEYPEFVDVADYALRHRDVIQRFGRFPHRNRILNRVSTPEEVEFLKQPGSSF